MQGQIVIRLKDSHPSIRTIVLYGGRRRYTVLP